MCEFFDIRLGRVLAQGAQALADLLLLDLSIAPVVEQVEGFLEFCGRENCRSDGVSGSVGSGIVGDLAFITFNRLERVLFCLLVHVER